MKKKLICFVVLCLIHQFIFAALVDVYRKGTIKIVPDPHFGQGNDWESLFYDVNKHITVTSDGSVFVANVLKHNIYKFSPQGRHEVTFGQRGEGKGDLYFPGDLSVLDNRWILVGEYPLQCMVSLFNFSGKIDRKIRCKQYVFAVVALSDNKIAYKSIQHTNSLIEKHLIIIKDLTTLSEQIVETISLQRRGRIQLGNNRSFSMSQLSSNVILARNRDGHLVVGITSSPHIKIYSLTGRLIKTVELKLSPIPVTSEYIENFKKDIIDSRKNNKYQRASPKWLIKKLEEFDFASILDKHLQMYTTFMIDPEGNLLVFPNSTCIHDCKIMFQVYNCDGKYICNTYIDKGPFDFEIQSNRIPFVINGTSLYGLFERQGSDDIALELIKSDLK